MRWGSKLKPGLILLHKNFVFADGTTKDKYLIVLGLLDGVIVAAKTTSKGHRYRNDHGCQAGNYYPAFLLTAGCCALPLNTWVCLSEFYELQEADLVQGVTSGGIFRFGYLDGELTKDVQFCASMCDDITMHQEAIIKSSIAP
ncbi:hypothetical protein [Achromobacter xylosoxidans]|uniref:hypothetical protein n=1 Tax=Alcaligenes xylosoxydans xylosoxydans TaxID=85698 RepID=UPI001EEC4507|nr:hypothetical protein [Achromobacter xylosoxidans]